METHALLFLAAVVGGVVNATGGGGGLITFPLLMTVVDPVTADATSGFALLPAYMTSTWVCRKQLAPVRHWFWLLLGPCLLGGLLGALLLSRSGDRSFVALVPWLVLAATLLILLRPLLTRRAKPPGSPADPPPVAPPASPARLQVGAGVLLFFVAIYGGYFGAGIGILVIGALGLIGLTEIHSVVALKNALACGLRGVAVILLVIDGKVDWGFGLVMAAGAILGGYLGGWAVRWTNRRVVRTGVLTLGFGLAAYYFWKVYGSEIPLIGGD